MRAHERNGGRTIKSLVLSRRSARRVGCRLLGSRFRCGQRGGRLRKFHGWRRSDRRFRRRRRIGGATDGGLGGSAGLTGSGGSAGSTVACIPLAPITRRVWPLQPVHYGNATRDLLSLATAPAAENIPVYAPPPPFASTLAIDATYLFALYQMAGVIATQVAPGAAALAACGAGDTDAACATRFARSFGRQAFRRALDDVEVTDMMKVFAKVCPGPSASCASPADFATAINLMIKAFILAPSFLYRTELGPRSLTANAAGVYPDTALTADEVATQLGFLLFGSTPDAGLLAAADSGALDTPAGILSELNRLLALPAVQTNVTGMVAQWLGVDRLADKTHREDRRRTAVPWRLARPAPPGPPSPFGFHEGIPLSSR